MSAPMHAGREVRWCLRMNRRMAASAWRPVFCAASRLGDGPVWVVLGLLIALLDLEHGLRVALQIGAVALVGGTLYRWLKKRTLRPRPFVRCRRIHALMPPLDEFSFPSGHTLHAVSISSIAIAHYPALAWLLAPFTALVAMSRVVLGLHYPSDVLAATVMGFALAAGALVALPVMQ